MSYYPLATGNKWTYSLKDGNTYFNEVTAAEGNVFTMKNSMFPNPVQLRKDGTVYHANHWDGTNFQVMMKDDAAKGDTWEVKFTANGLESVLVNTVKETGISKEVAGKNYPDVIMVEAESKLIMNGNLMALNYFTQYYFANGVGLILTTTSSGDEQALKEYSLN